MNVFKINRKAADRVASGHPWIFKSDITGQAEPGEVVEVHSERGKFFGIAQHSSTSQIALRLLTTRREPIDRDFFRRRLQQAIEFRQRIVENSDACRTCFSEADLLPG